MTEKQKYLLGQLNGLTAQTQVDTNKLRWELLIQLLETMLERGLG